MPLLLIFIAWVALEIYTFILIGDAIGYLATIGVFIATSYIGIAITRKVLAHDLKALQISMDILMGQGGRSVDPSDRLYKALNEKLSQQAPEEAGRFIMTMRKRCLKDQGIIALFVIPGFITDIFGFLFLILGLKSGLVDGMFSGKVMEKANAFGGFATRGTDPYGKSARDLQKEAEAFAKAQQGNIPTVRPNAGSATVEEMKSRFQAEKEIKDAKYEEIKDDD